MTVVAADGQYVHPVSVDEFRIATAETYDVIVEPSGQEAFTLFAQSNDRTGFAAGTLATRAGLRAPVPALDPRPILTMVEMGHGGMHHRASTTDAPATGTPTASAPAPPDPHASHSMPAARPADPHGAHGAQPPAPVDPHAGHAMASAGRPQQHPASENGNPLVDMQAMSPTSRLDDPGIGCGATAAGS